MDKKKRILTIVLLVIGMIAVVWGLYALYVKYHYFIEELTGAVSFGSVLTFTAGVLCCLFLGFGDMLLPILDSLIQLLVAAFWGD